MRIRETPATLLLKLPLKRDVSQRRATFRQAMTALAQAMKALGPPPLDGIDSVALEASVHIAAQHGFLDDLEFIDPGAATVALYELSSAVPTARVKRDLRRRVFTLLYRGNASTFLPVATRMALGASGPLSTPTLQARVGLCLDLAPGSSVNVGPLALALCTRSATFRHWVEDRSSGALSDRRMAALLYEHAAREALFRSQLGDTQPLTALCSSRWGQPLARLLLDREPLVWRHAAIARGLLAAIDEEVRHQVAQSLDPALSITEWRRGAVSLVASTALADEEAHRSVLSVLDGPLAQRDRGLPAAMVTALPRVWEQEPDRAIDLANHLAATRRVDVAIAFSEILHDDPEDRIAPGARGMLREVLIEAGKRQSAIERSLSSRALRILSFDPSEETSLSGRERRALLAFEEQSAQQAHELALGAMTEAHELAAFIETNNPRDEAGLGAAISSLVELDAGALERATLNNLLLLGKAPGDTAGVVEQFERLQNRTSRWILDGVQAAGEMPWSRDGATADQRRLQVLLHLVDSSSVDVTEGRTSPLVHRLENAVVILLERIAQGPDAVVHRVLCAALARSFDAAVREGVVEASDLTLTVASRLEDGYSVSVIAEASTTPDVAEPLLALARFMGSETAGVDAAAISSAYGLRQDDAGYEMARALARVDDVLSLGRGLVGGGGYHAEALRRVIFRLGRCLERVALAQGQSQLVQSKDGGVPVLEDLARCCEQLATMVRCSHERVFSASLPDERDDDEASGIFEVVERGVQSESLPASDEVALAVQSMTSSLPGPIARAVEQVLLRIEKLPIEPPQKPVEISIGQRRALLPDWLLPRRSIGSFHVVSPLGAGGVSSVFLARRLEERNNPKAEAFALKVPEYDPSTARSMTEQEFFQMFRDEAGALLSLPAHENLARFVTFDLSARPKPILVMELIVGTPLDRLIRSRALTMPRVLAHLDGVLAGLEAMHAVEVGHLDVKPSNVILREGKTPVLVDFGLSGRTLRPGCGTVEYTCPEVLGVVPEGSTPSPMKADIYAFGCMMFEMLTGKALFSGGDELALVGRHVSHDGWLPELAKMARVPSLERIAKLLGSTLRHDGRNRPDAVELRAEITPALMPLTDAEWPLKLSAIA